jgi:chromate transporter
MPNAPAGIWDLARLFLKLGTLAFGGPAAHIAMMRQEVVEKRAWLSDSEFLDLLGAANLIPGPSSTELAIHIGFRQARWLGLLTVGACFILPAAIMVTVLAWLYQSFHAMPQVAALLYGVKPVVVAIVLQAVSKLAVASLRTTALQAVFFCAFILAAMNVHQLLILTLCGLAALTVLRPGLLRVFIPLGYLASPLAIAPPVSLSRLFLLFAKIGSIVFGSGYVLLAFLQSELVDKLHWLDSRQLLDAVAIGQVTPGPVFTTATFIGYLLAGIPGAVVATLAIFLPGFILVAASGPLIPKIRSSPSASAFLNGVTAGSIALIAWVLLLLGRAALIDTFSIGIAAVCVGLLVRFGTNAAWLIGAGALLGLLSRTVI